MNAKRIKKDAMIHTVDEVREVDKFGQRRTICGKTVRKFYWIETADEATCPKCKGERR